MANQDDQPTKGTGSLRPRARLMRTLGDELISSETVALIELVKNAYDADATRVLLRFKEPLEVGHGVIEVIDDGHGMTLDTVRGAFLEPATHFRKRATESEEFGRTVTGEKGIGRFAVSRLADELELVSRRRGAPTETRVLFDWRLFDDEDAYLDQVEIAWETTDAADIAPGGVVQALWADGLPSGELLYGGTLLRLRGLRTRWQREQIDQLRTALARLVSPFLFEKQRAARDAFSIFIEVPPIFAGLSGRVEPPEALRNSHYLLRGAMEADGAYSVQMRLRTSNDEVPHNGRVLINERPPTCGPFEFELRVWDRDAESMRTLAEQLGTKLTDVRSDLDRVAGINVYRDGFRVLPYGEPGNDWLELDSRRINNPTLRLSNNQILGFVLISKGTNPSLRDQTNREGLLRNQAYEDLRGALREIIARLEQARYSERRPPEPGPRPGAGRGLFSGFDLAAVRNYVAEQYAGDHRLKRLLGETEAAIERDIERAQEVVVRYRRLATLGELIDKVLHDGRAPLAKIGDEADIGLRSLERRDKECEDLLADVKVRLGRVSTQHDVLATVFRRIEPFGGRRRGRPARLVLEAVITDAFGVLESDIKRLGIQVRLPKTETPVTVDAAELQEIIVNLLDNSLHWLRFEPNDSRAIQVDVNRDDEGVHIVFSDSGPGVREGARESIFDPYFSTKENGIGLGLSIAGEIIDEYYGGELRLLETGPLKGATFQATLKRRI
jgi:signal transduction histidine kinase